MAVHHLFHDTGGARIIGLMHHGVLAVKHPVIGVGPFDPHAVITHRHFRRADQDGAPDFCAALARESNL
jgi:hypothetical protein